MSFIDVARSILANIDDSIECRICPDQYVGIINSFTEEQEDFIRSVIQERPKNLNCVILVLESPHIQEFIGEASPAKGKTGANIRKYISTIPGLGIYKDYGLILTNAIQYQCSLGFPTKYFRDAVFEKMWNSNCKTSFIKRLDKILNKKDVIVNCCTKGNNRNEETHIRNLIQQAMIDKYPNAIILRRTHPSSWYAKKNRDYEWNY